MKNKKGFTLVELLVVMAVISILAAIIVPNVARYIARARATRALGDIKAIELALTKMTTDANVQDLNGFFNPDAVREFLGITPGQYLTTEQFKRSIALYRNCLYALLREGRRVLDGRTDPDFGMPYSGLLNTDVVMRLGVGYLEDIAYDPWGNLYNIYPGPWKPSNGPVPFRIYMLGENELTLPGVKGGTRRDSLTLGGKSGNIPEYSRVIDPETGLDMEIGYPAEKGKFVFIWSNGANLISGQALYNPNLALPLPNGSYGNRKDNYESQDDEYKGGGDDINNWDPGQSWMRFYAG